MNAPLISIIIPTKNSASTIDSCLKSIKTQTYKNIEIIIVDNHSKDTTLKRARKYTSRTYLKGQERSEQRNYGALKAKGEYLAWFDSDMQITPHVISECVERITSDHDIKALIIPERSIGKGFWANCRALEKTCYLGDQAIEAIRFIDRQTFSEINGFSANFISGEDWNITHKVRQKGYAIGRIKSYVNHREGSLKLSQDIKKKYYYATKSLPYIQTHIRKPLDIIRFVLRPAFFRNWRYLFTDPLHTSGLLIMKTCEFSAGFAGITSAAFKRLSSFSIKFFSQ